MKSSLPENPTADQLKQIVQAIIQEVFEPDGVIVGEVEPIDGDGWRVLYKTQGRDFELSYRDGYFLKGPVGAEDVADFSEESDDSDTIAQYSEQLRTAVGPIVDDWVAAMRNLLDGAGDLADFSEKLLTLYPDLDGGRLRTVMADAMLAASLAATQEE